MKPILELIIPGSPVPQPKHSARVIAGRACSYMPTSRGKGAQRRSNGIAEFRALVRKIAAERYQGPLLECPLAVDCEFVFPRTKGMLWKRKPMPRLPHAVRPDRDNLDKAVLDALKGVIWRDDQQVSGGTLWKFYAAGGEQPHTRILISLLEERTPANDLPW